MVISRAAIDGIGYAAATMTTMSFVPQLLRVLKLRSARDISLGMFLIFSAGTFAWMVYGFLTGSAPVWVANVVTFGLSVTILGLKLRFDKKALDEVEIGGADGGTK
jgi:MtN3 and saliva related transmembrane protein